MCQPGVMALPLTRCCRQASGLLLARRWCTSTSSPVAPATLRSSSPVVPATLHSRLLLLLSQRFYDIDMILRWYSLRKHGALRRKNASYDYSRRHYGENVATAYYILSMKGSVRYVGQSEWFRPGRWGRLNWDFLNHKETPIEEIDMSNTLINSRGMENLVGQPSLRTLSLRGCPEVDDWSLTRLHEFQDSLEELDISHCPRITAGGLSALSHLKRLRRLDISSLPRLSSPGLVIILLEEMLPHCLITATGYDISLRPEGGEVVEQRSDRGRVVELAQ